MKLEKTINVEVYEVLAEYKVNTKSPLLSILQFVQENDFVDNEKLLDLLAPLTLSACNNLLVRLERMGYLEKTGLFFETSQLGEKAVQNNEFYDQRKGILKVYIAKDVPVRNRIIRIDQKTQNDTRDKKEIKGTIDDLELECTLKGNTYFIENTHDYYIRCKKESKKLTLTVSNKGETLAIEDFEEISHNYTKQSVQDTLLFNHFDTEYSKSEHKLSVEYDAKDLSFNRNIKIEKPTLEDVAYDSVTLKDVSVYPQEKDVEKWFKALLLSEITTPIVEEHEFNDIAFNVANRFEKDEEQLKETVSRKDLANETEDFYKRSHLETIDYLTY